jgi:hypothetical protein
VEVVEEVGADEVEVLVHQRHGARGKTGRLGGQGETMWQELDDRSVCGTVVVLVVLVLSADGY